MLDFMEKTKCGKSEPEPVRKETVERVVGSSAMKMADDNYDRVSAVLGR